MLSEKRIRKIIREEINLIMATALEKAMETGVINALQSLGITAQDRHECQKDFHHLRKHRRTTEEAKGNILRTLISVGIGAAVVGGFEAFKSVMH